MRSGVRDETSVDLSEILEDISESMDTRADPLARALCQAEFGGLTKWIIWPLSHHLFPFFSPLLSALSCCKKESEWGGREEGLRGSGEKIKQTGTLSTCQMC